MKSNNIIHLWLVVCIPLLFGAVILYSIYQNILIFGVTLLGVLILFTLFNKAINRQWDKEDENFNRLLKQWSWTHEDGTLPPLSELIGDCEKLIKMSKEDDPSKRATKKIKWFFWD